MFDSGYQQRIEELLKEADFYKAKLLFAASVLAKSEKHLKKLQGHEKIIKQINELIADLDTLTNTFN